MPKTEGSASTVLVTAIGTVTSTTIVRQLKQAGSCHIIGADIFKADEVATSLDVDEFYVFPSAADDETAYLAHALDFCRGHKVDYYFASIDEEVVNLSRNRRKFASMGTKLCVPNNEFVEVCHYKDRFISWVKEHMPTIAIKTYASPDEVDDGAYPLFVKPIEGRASIGCRKLANRVELEEYERSEVAADGFVIQEFQEGPILTVDLARNANTGQAMAVQRIEKLRNPSGCGIAVEIVDYEELDAICRGLMIELGLNGVANAEFIQTCDGFKIIEINPRFAAGSVFTCMAGYDIVSDAIRIANGTRCDMTPVEIGLRFAKRYETYRMD